MTISYTIAIPARNEELVIEKTLRGLVEEFRSQPDVEILVIDNHSTDGTWEKLGLMSSQSPQVRFAKSEHLAGYGVAVRAAIKQAKGQYIVLAMADGSESPSDIHRFIQASRENPGACVFGNRFDRSSNISGYPGGKRILNRLANFALSVCTGKKLADLTNGFKLYPSHLLAEIGQKIDDGFSSTLQLSLHAAISGIPIVTVAHDWHGREAGESKFSLLREALPYIRAALSVSQRSHKR